MGLAGEAGKLLPNMVSYCLHHCLHYYPHITACITTCTTTCITTLAGTAELGAGRRLGSEQQVLHGRGGR